MLTQKDFHPIPKLNLVVRQFAAAGLMRKWEKGNTKVLTHEDAMAMGKKMEASVHSKLTLG